MVAPESGGLTVEIKRVLRAAPSVVFGAFSDPDKLAKWWGPEGFAVRSLDFNPRVGAGEATEVVCTQGSFRTSARCALHRDGWSDSFDKLERIISS